MKEKIPDILKQLGNSDDIITKEVALYESCVTLLYCETVVSSDLVNRYLLDATAKASFLHVPIPDEKAFFMQVVPGLNVKEIELKDVPFYLLNGFVIIFGTNFIIAIETRAMLDSGVQPSQNEKVLEGPKDAFTENIEKNIGLIRKRLPVPDLRVKSSLIGRNSKTKLSYCYMESIANPKLVQRLVQKLNAIDIDFVSDNNQLKVLLRESGMPTMYATERPDKVVEALSEGKIVVLLNGSPYVLLMPMFFPDFFKTSDDYYQHFAFTLFNRIIRGIAFFLAIFLPGIFVAVTTHNYDSLNLPLLIIFYAQRVNVPFPAFIEALLLILSFEILRESDLRSPSSMSAAMSIVGALVLGQAAVDAGIVSPITVIVVAFTSICSLVFTDIDFMNGIRSWRFIFILASSILGIIGILSFAIIWLVKLSSLENLETSYLSPFAPFSKKDQNNAIYKAPEEKLINRPNYISTLNPHRQRRSK